MRTKNFIQTAALMLGMTISSVMITSCTAEDNPVNEPTYDPEVLRYVEGVPVTVSNQLLEFQNHIVEIDSLGNFVSRLNGVPLNREDTTVLSIGVKDLAEARTFFNEWLPDNPEITETAPNVVTFYPKDENGAAQGEIYFTASSSEEMVAEVTYSSTTDLRHFTSIQFIPESLWPPMGSDDGMNFKLWQVYKMKGPDGKEGDYQCIRERSFGKLGLLALVKDKQNPAGHHDPKTAKESVAKEAHKALKDNWDKWKYSDFGERVWINKNYLPLSHLDNSYTINLKKGNITFWEWIISSYYYVLFPKKNRFGKLYIIEF